MLQCRLLNVPNVTAVDINIAIDLGDARLIKEAAMSTLGSSVINKSGKKFAPKAPVRRAAASTSTQNSARASVDRQILSQTPQPQAQTQSQPQPQDESQSQQQQQLPRLRNSQLRAANSTIPPVSQFAPLSSQQPAHKESPTSSHNDRPVPVSASLSSTPSNAISAAAEAPPPPQANPRKRTLEAASPSAQGQAQSIVSAEINTAPVNSQDAASRKIGTEPSSLSTPMRSGSSQDTSTATHPSSRPNTPPLSTAIGGSQNTAPGAKRRKLKKQQQEILIVLAASHTDVNVPLQSTETDGVVAQAPENAQARSTALQSRINPPVKAPQPAKARKPRTSAKENRKQRVEIAEAETAADPARGSSAPNGTGCQESKRPRRKKSRTHQEKNIENAAPETVADAIQGSSNKRKPKRRRTRRETTPEDAEEERIIPSEMKMSDLCKNFRTGRKSAREVELEKIEKAGLVQKKQRQNQKLQKVTTDSESSGQLSESGDQRLERLAHEKRDRDDASLVVPNTIIVDGQIQIDETSLQLDRHANAAEERDAEQLEGVDESELTRRVNQGSWAKRDKSGSWNEESTDKFYDGLRMFGTDFQMISKLLPGRTRHSVKLKFCKEEKLDKEKIKRTLMGERIPVDMEEYSKISNTTYADPKELERELEEDRKRMEAEHAAEKEAIDEIRRQREAEAAAEGAAVGDDSSAKENRDVTQETAPAKGKKGKKAAKAKKKSCQGKMGDEGGQKGVLGPIDKAVRQEAASADASVLGEPGAN